MCICPEGYSKVGDTDDCEDIDECQTLPNVCENGYCTNIEGGFQCDCFPGFRANYDSTKCIGESPNWRYDNFWEILLKQVEEM